MWILLAALLAFPLSTVHAESRPLSALLKRVSSYLNGSSVTGSRRITAVAALRPIYGALAASQFVQALSIVGAPEARVAE